MVQSGDWDIEDVDLFIEVVGVGLDEGDNSLEGDSDICDERVQSGSEQVGDEL